ncbi:MAG: carbohydrate ABC transporter permease, partial [Chloroflexi bacterium]|nr:carbohydrate ABC transporter permease [Chloroflexota bacterium]
MARTVTPRRKLLNTTIAWAIGLLIFFPILWTILTSFKSEGDAIAAPPIFIG